MKALVGAAMIALGVITGSSAIAGAEPSGDQDREWDIGAYDHCIDLGYPAVNCCIESGGDWVGPNAGSGKCVAPPLKQDIATLPPGSEPTRGLPTVPRAPLPTAINPGAAG
ncbi:hypothetical protein ABQF34_11380 [Mycolicibacterium boenickei]